MVEEPPGDGRSIDNPTEASDMPDELEQSVRSDADRRPVAGERRGAAGTEGEKVEQPGDGLVPREGVNEPGTAQPRRSS